MIHTVELDVLARHELGADALAQRAGLLVVIGIEVDVRVEYARRCSYCRSAES